MNTFIITYQPEGSNDSGSLPIFNALQSAYEQHYHERNIPTTTQRFTSIDKLVKDVCEKGFLTQNEENNDEYIYIFVDEYGAQAIRYLKSKNVLKVNDSENIEIVWSGHNPVKGIENLPVDTIFLPKFSTFGFDNIIASRCHLVRLPAVLTIPIEETDGVKNKAKVQTDRVERSIIWMLGGDARKNTISIHNEPENWLVLPPKHTEFVIEALKDANMLDAINTAYIVNGPSTARIKITYDPKDQIGMSIFTKATVVENSYHDYPLNYETNIDPITRAAKSAIEKVNKNININISHYWRERVSDDETVYHSDYNEKMHEFFNNEESLLLVSGESAVEISKLVSSTHAISQRERIFVILTDSMTDELSKWVIDLLSQGYFSCIDARLKHSPAVLPIITDDACPVAKNPMDTIMSYLRTRPLERAKNSLEI